MHNVRLLQRRLFTFPPKVLVRYAIVCCIISFLSHIHEASSTDFKFRDMYDSKYCAVFGSNGYHNPGLCVGLSFDGEIAAGDAENLAAYIKRGHTGISGVSWYVSLIYLNSPGGDVDEAIKIGRILRDNRIQAWVAFKDKCLSACVLILSGGVIRGAAGQVGVHSISNPAWAIARTM